MSKLTYLLILISIFISSQEIKVLNKKTRKPLKDVLVYKNDKYIGITNIEGNLFLTDELDKNDTIILNKNNFEVLKLFKHELTNQILMDSIRYKNIDVVSIKKYDNVKLLEKIREKLLQKIEFYPIKRNFFQQISSLVTNNKKLLYFNDKFYANEMGIFSNVLSNNFYADFKVITKIDKKYNQKYLKYSDKYIFSRSFTCGIGTNINNDLFINEIFNNPKKFIIQSNINNDKQILLKISNKNITANMVVDSEDFGIYEFLYERKNFHEKSPKYFDEKPQSYFFIYEKVKYTNDKIKNIYIPKDFSIISNFINENDGTAFKFKTERNNIEEFNVSGIKKINLCDLKSSN